MPDNLLQPETCDSVQVQRAFHAAVDNLWNSHVLSQLLRAQRMTSLDDIEHLTREWQSVYPETPFATDLPEASEKDWISILDKVNRNETFSLHERIILFALSKTFHDVSIIFTSQKVSLIDLDMKRMSKLWLWARQNGQIMQEYKGGQWTGSLE